MSRARRSKWYALFADAEAAGLTIRELRTAKKIVENLRGDDDYTRGRASYWTVRGRGAR